MKFSPSTLKTKRKKMMRVLVCLLLLCFLEFSTGFLQKRDENAPEPNARALREALEERLATEGTETFFTQERNLGVGDRPSSKSGKGKGGSSKSSKKGSKKISKNGSKKKHYEDVELNFMIQMTQYGDSAGQGNETLGTKFVFSGDMAIDDDTEGWQGTEENLGTASGSCVVCLSAPQWCCDFFFTFDKNGGDFYDFGTVSLSGWIMQDTGKLWVLGSGGDFVASHNGGAELQLDPYGNPIIYTKLNLRA